MQSGPNSPTPRDDDSFELSNRIGHLFDADELVVPAVPVIGAEASQGPLARLVADQLKEDGFRCVHHNSRLHVPFAKAPRPGSQLLLEAEDRVSTYLRGNGVDAQFELNELLYNPRSTQFMMLATLVSRDAARDAILPFKEVATNAYTLERFPAGACLLLQLDPYPNADRVRIQRMEYPDMDAYLGSSEIEPPFSGGSEIESPFDLSSHEAVSDFSSSLDENWRSSSDAAPNSGLRRYFTLEDPASLREYKISLTPLVSVSAFLKSVAEINKGAGIVHEELLRSFAEAAYIRTVPLEMREFITDSSKFYWIEKMQPKRDFHVQIRSIRDEPDRIIVGCQLNSNRNISFTASAQVRYDKQKGSFEVSLSSDRNWTAP